MNVNGKKSIWKMHVFQNRIHEMSALVASNCITGAPGTGS
jgi:hypothetical protein